MPTYKDIRCTIRVNHKTLREYKDEDDDQSPATKTVYVQAREAETFSIRCKVLPDYEPAVGDRVSFRVYIAGKECCRKSINIVGGHRHKHLNLQGAYGVDDGGNEFVHPFQFAGVSLVEDHESDIRVDPRSLANMGEISVYVVRTRRIPNSNRFPAPRAAVELASIERVNEKSLKGKDLTHVTKLGPPKSLGRGEMTTKTEECDSNQNPFIHFRFLYRSKGTLQHLGLIPLEPPPLLAEGGSQSASSREIAVKQETMGLRTDPEFGGGFRAKQEIDIKEEESEDDRHPKRIKLSGVAGRSTQLH